MAAQAAAGGEPAVPREDHHHLIRSQPRERFDDDEGRKKARAAVLGTSAERRSSLTGEGGSDWRSPITARELNGTERHRAAGREACDFRFQNKIY